MEPSSVLEGLFASHDAEKGQDAEDEVDPQHLFVRERRIGSASSRPALSRDVAHQRLKDNGSDEGENVDHPHGRARHSLSGKSSFVVTMATVPTELIVMSYKKKST